LIDFNSLKTTESLENFITGNWQLATGNWQLATDL